MPNRPDKHTSNFASYEMVHLDGKTIVKLAGDWRHRSIEDICTRFPALPQSFSQKSVIVDFNNVSHIDTAGIWLLHKFEVNCEVNNITSTFENASDKTLSLLAKIPKTLQENDHEDDQEHNGGLRTITRQIRQAILAILTDVGMGLNILGAMIEGPQLKNSRRSSMSVTAIVTQIDHIGVRAVPIIILISLIIGAIITQQAAFQLRTFGAEIFAADLMSILQLREVGILITSIMIAGRSGSAITAEIGTMKMREEIDALKVMGLNPVSVLVFPRLVALIFVLPLLTIVSNFAALFASAVVLHFYADVSFNVFFERMKMFTDYTTLISGMIKTPFMAITIGIIASVEGLKVGGSAESLGRRVTASVVKSIFLVIVLDGIFAIFYATIDF